MPYVLEKISADDIQKIFRDLNYDNSKKRWLEIRGGHFNSERDLKWAIDRISNSYLFKAPNVIMSGEYTYYFFYQAFMYRLVIDQPIGPVIYFEDPIDRTSRKQKKLEVALIEAFNLYRIYGSDSDPQINFSIGEKT
jgi:hypothetical protein